MISILESARAIAHTLLSREEGDITEDVLLKIIDRTSAINNIEGQNFDPQELFEMLKADYSIGKGEITILSDEIEPWLSEEKSNIRFELWNRYRLHLSQNDPTFPVNDLHDFTDKILDKCVNPKNKGSWDRRGMVVGHVQSGKTSNYVGLIDKATDAGYKVIIIIAGTIGSLRRQTQERIDEGYIGRSSSAFINNKKENRVTGVGMYKVNTDIYSLTSSYYVLNDEGDFSQSVANRLNIPIGKNPVVFVVKKNKSILENLIDWLSKNENVKIVEGTPILFDVPALIIDDEADAASVNASKNIDEIKTINRLIRSLLNVFNQKTFIGYTATPYANLFIPQEFNETLTTTIKGRNYKIGEDLFPRDFIINIKAPSNYIGAAKVFGYENANPELTKEPLDVFREVNDFAISPFFIETRDSEGNIVYRMPNGRDSLPDYIPQSLCNAVKSFILTCAIRRLRGQATKHNSMLVHVALLVKWIDRVAYLVNEKVKEYQDAIESEDEKLLEELRFLYETDFRPTTENVLENLDYIDLRIKEHDWKDVKQQLKKAVSKIEVRSVHGTRSTSNLEYHNIEEIDYKLYENGLSVIAVGGSRLSRGITLEGLSISYYLRTTKMYDSLMQMGRWFGYRPGYVDLCRLFTTMQIFEWFNHITLATEEMRNDFDELTAARQRPKDYRLKVRNHHGLLTITSIAKLNFAENINISFSGSNPQTYKLLKTKSAIENNFNSLKSLIASVGFPEKQFKKEARGKVRYLHYPNQSVDPICDFIDTFRIEQPSISNSTLSEYIKAQSRNNRISEWSICIVSNTDEKVFINRYQNNPDNSKTPKDTLMTCELVYGDETFTLGCTVRNQPKETRDSEYYFIAKSQIDDLKDRQVDLSVNNYKTNREIKDQRAKEGKGLLLIYALDERGTSNVDYGIPIIGYSLHFPKIDNEVQVSYTATTNRGFDEEIMEDDDNTEKE